MGSQKLFSFAATDNNKRLKEGTKREMRVNTSFPIQKKTCRFALLFALVLYVVLPAGGGGGLRLPESAGVKSSQG